jgi:hypothetical protein
MSALFPLPLMAPFGMGRDQNRDQRRRQRTLHAPRGVHECDEVVIDVAACRGILDNGALDDAEILLTLVAIRSGGGVVTFRELKHMALATVLEAGTVEAAIKQLRLADRQSL